MSAQRLSIYLSYLLRHHPEDIGLAMDEHGWVSLDELIDRINAAGTHRIDRVLLGEIVAADNKGRYRFSDDATRIKACQGHSIPWVIPELTVSPPPPRLYHGTTTAAYQKITADGAIRKMARHAVHMQADAEKAWGSAVRWHLTPVILVIDAAAMDADGFVFGVSDNEVWCTDHVPTKYIIGQLTAPPS